MKSLGVAITAIILGVAGVLAVNAVRFDDPASAEDLIGSSIAMAITGAALVALLYWPALAFLRRKWGALSVWRAVAVTLLGLNAPVYAGLLLLGRNREIFAAGEVLTLVIAAALIGTLFSAGFARLRQAAT